MSLSDIVNVVISKEAASISRASFGTILVAAHHTHNVDRVREYSGSSILADMVADSFAVTEPAYKIVSKILSQSPHVSKVKIGRLTTAWNQTIKIVPTVANTTIFSGVMNALPWTFTSDGTATLAEICTGIAAAIDALAGITATVTDTNTTVTAVVTATDTLMNFSAPTGAGVFSFEDITADTTLGADLLACRAADVDWYGLVIDCPSHTRNLTAAAFAEADTVVFAASSADYLFDATSIYDDLHALSYARTGVFYHPDADAHPGAAAMGVVFPYDPGAATWKFKTLSGVSIPVVSATIQGLLKAFKSNYYIAVSGKGITTEGVTASGEFIDITQAIDYIHARMSEAVFALLVSAPKLPYDDVTGDRIRNTMEGVLKDAQDRLLIGDYTITMPLVAAQTAGDRAARRLSGIEFDARLLGAVHAASIHGTLSL